MIARTPADEERNLQEIISSGRFPGFVGSSDRGIAAAEERTYRTHNVTRRFQTETMGGEPNSPSMQCQCGDCASHRRRAPITGTADKGKDV